MGMKRLTLLVLAVGLVFCAGCGPTKPLTESEFKGNCFHAGGMYQYDCDTISLCNEYLTVLNLPQGSLAQCLKACQDIYAVQSVRNTLNECSRAAGNARDWCQRYCRGAYSR